MASNIFSDISPDITQTTNTPDYTNRSKGFMSGKEATAGLIKGAADVTGMLIQAKDQYFKDTIQEQATAAVDLVREDFIDNARSKIAQPLPAGLTGGLRDIEKLNASKRQGRTKDSAYWANLDNISKTLRARYPGYREEIDQAVKSLVGTTPANALVNAVAQEADRAAAGSSENLKQRFNFFKTEGKYIPKAAYDAEKSGQPWTMLDLLESVGNSKRADYNVERAKAQIELSNASIRNTEAQRTLSINNSSDLHNKMVHRAWVEIQNEYYPSINKLAEQGDNEVKVNGRISPETSALIQDRVAQAKRALSERVAQINAENPNLPVAIMKENTDRFNAILDAQLKSAVDGTLQATAVRTKAAMENVESALTAQRDLALQAAVYKNFGNSVSERLFGLNQVRNMNAIGKVRFTDLFNKHAMGQATAEDILRSELSNDQKTALLKEGSRNLSEKNTTPEGFDSQFKMIYNDPSYIGRVANTNKDARELFNNYYNPAMTATVIRKAQELGNPDYITQYANWGRDVASRLFHRELSAINDVGRETNNYNVNWDSKTNRFVAEPTQALKDTYSKRIGDTSLIDRTTRNINQTTLGPVNNIVRNLLPVWQQLGLDPKQEAANLVGRSWETMNDKSPGFIDMFRKWINPTTVQPLRFSMADFDQMQKDLAKIDTTSISNANSDLPMDTIAGILNVLEKHGFSYTPPDRVSTNVEDVTGYRPGKFAAPGLTK